MAKYSSYEDIMRNKKTMQRSNRIDYRNLQIPKIQPKAKEETIEKSEMDSVTPVEHDIFIPH